MNPLDPSPSPHLLLLDDDRLVLSTFAISLRQEGYRVSTAETVEEAEALLAGGGHPDLAILDIRLSGQSGLHLARRLHTLDHIPFMMLSAYSEPALVEEASQHGALGYLVKPLDMPQLLPAIQAALARANELQDLRATRQQLQAALDTERNISVAVGITMMRHHLPRREAFELLRKSARSRRCKLAELATGIIQAEETLKL